MAEEQKEEELKFLERGDIKTMQKDLKSVREKAAQIERERIAALTIKKEKLKAGALEQKQSKTISPRHQATKIDIIPKKIRRRPSKYEKYLVRALMVLVFFSLILLVVGIIIENEKNREVEEKIIEEPIEEPTETEPIEDPETSVQELIINNFVSWGYKIPESPRNIDTIIIHSGYSVGEDPYDIFQILEKYKNYNVSPHYFIDRKGNIYLLVPDEYVAYHAGDGVMPDGTRKNVVNEFSISIELIYGIEERPEPAQYKSLALLIDSFLQKYQIVPGNILRRSEISADHTDPWNFSWIKLNSYRK